MPQDIINEIKKMAPYMKFPVIDDGYFTNVTDPVEFIFSMNNVGGTFTGEYDDVINFDFKEPVIKRGVKFDYTDKAKGFAKSVAQCTSDDDVIGVCVDYDDFSGQAQVKMLNQTWNEILVAKKGAVFKANDKLKFVAKGEVDKQTAQGGIHLIALSAPVKITEDLFLVEVAINGYKGK